MTALFKDGDRVIIWAPDHPWHGYSGTLMVFEPYGPRMFNWQGWKINLDNGMQCYANPADIKLMKRAI